MNVLRWCPFFHLFDAPFQSSPYGHGFPGNFSEKFFCKTLGNKLFWKIFLEILNTFCSEAVIRRCSLKYRCFPVNIAKFLRTAFFVERLRWLL